MCIEVEVRKELRGTFLYNCTICMHVCMYIAIHTLTYKDMVFSKVEIKMNTRCETHIVRYMDSHRGQGISKPGLQNHLN